MFQEERIPNQTEDQVDIPGSVHIFVGLKNSKKPVKVRRADVTIVTAPVMRLGLRQRASLPAPLLLDILMPCTICYYMYLLNGVSITYFLYSNYHQ